MDLEFSASLGKKRFKQTAKKLEINNFKFKFGVGRYKRCERLSHGSLFAKTF